MKDLPTVKFDPSRVTSDVQAAVKARVEQIAGLDPSNFQNIYEASLRSVSAGRDLATLYVALLALSIEGMNKKRAKAVALHINNVATAVMAHQRQKEMGVTHAVWLYSGAPCVKSAAAATPQDRQQDAAHRAANGKRFVVSDGMFVNGVQTWPGMEEGCRCFAKSEIAGFT